MPDNYFARYLPLLIHLGIALALGGAMVLLSQLLGRHSYSRAKFQPYECGMNPVGDARERFSVKFYMVAMLFILFDVEAVFLYPWAILLKELKMFGFWEMLVYVSVLLVGLFYVWKKGVLDWAETKPTPRGTTFDTPLFEASTASAPGHPVHELVGATRN
ncbi:MAG: NADH-quinone oxidoreductase subunit A [Terriglobales bacterium]|jgi:NADH-quinone oxidoreductase subunit A